MQKTNKIVSYVSYKIFFRVLTGAFDKVVKVWSQDGQVMHKFEGFRYITLNYNLKSCNNCQNKNPSTVKNKIRK